MRHDVLPLIALGIALAFPVRGPADTNRVLAGWGLGARALEADVAAAADVGFDALVFGAANTAQLAQAVAACRPHGIAVYACLMPMAESARAWEARHPGRPVPWQVMTEAETGARAFLAAGSNQFLAPFQFGGEPILTHEVLLTPILCLADPEVRAVLKAGIDRAAAVPGLAGVAFDGFGYQNYRRCHCAACADRLAAYRAAHPEAAAAEAETALFRGLLVDAINELADHVRAARADLKTLIHIWPVYAPEPLYGNRLDVDYCGQTAAWYTLWPADKIAAYSRRIAGEAKAHYARPEGEGMIGYYDMPGRFPAKDAARVDLELRTMLANGIRRVQVCGAHDVIRNPAVAAVFRAHFR